MLVNMVTSLHEDQQMASKKTKSERSFFVRKTFHVDRAVWQDVKELAVCAGRSIKDVATEALRQYLARHK